MRFFTALLFKNFNGIITVNKTINVGEKINEKRSEKTAKRNIWI